MLNGLDLFSGIGGLSTALEPWVRTVAYCENDKYSQAVLLSRMACREIRSAPIWDDVCTLQKKDLRVPVEIIFGGFPCQDISVAGDGVGLDGKRSGLFFEIVRLARELRPSFLFLENVPAITVRGLDRILMEFASLGYDARWTIVSAAELGAPHLRERWWLLAYSNGVRESSGSKKRNKPRYGSFYGSETLADASCSRLEGARDVSGAPGISEARQSVFGGSSDRREWMPEPDVGRVAHGVPNRVDRIKGLGNAVVPKTAREAFKRLMGIQ